MKTRNALPPATGKCRWVCQMTDSHAGVLQIDVENGRGKLVSEVYIIATYGQGYSLTKQDGSVYIVPGTMDGCTCPDAKHRRERAGGQCKHAKALRQALAVLGIKPICRHTREQLGVRTYGPGGGVTTLGGQYTGD